MNNTPVDGQQSPSDELFAHLGKQVKWQNNRKSY